MRGDPLRQGGRPEFKVALWVPCYRRTMAQISSDLWLATGPLAGRDCGENCRRSTTYWLPVDASWYWTAPAPEVVSQFISLGRTSTLITLDPVTVVESVSLAHARKLIGARRYAEAYDFAQHSNTQLSQGST